MNDFIQKTRAAFAKDFSVATLKLLIIAVAIVYIMLALSLDNPWILAGVLAYAVLP